MARWTDPEHLAFFKSQIPEYQVAVKQGRRAPHALQVAGEFHERWPARLSLWPDLPQERVLTKAEDDELKAHIAKTNRRVANKLKWDAAEHPSRAQKKEDANPAEKLLESLQKKTRAPQIRETMSTLWHGEKIRQPFDAAVEAYKAEHNGEITSEKRSTILQSTRDEVFTNLTTEEREFLENEHTRRVEARRVAQEADAAASDDRLRYFNNVPMEATHLLNYWDERADVVATMIFAGIDEEGKIRAFVVHKGNLPGGKTFGQANPTLIQQSVMPAFTKFAEESLAENPRLKIRRFTQQSPSNSPSKSPSTPPKSSASESPMCQAKQDSPRSDSSLGLSSLGSPSLYQTRRGLDSITGKPESAPEATTMDSETPAKQNTTNQPTIPTFNSGGLGPAMEADTAGLTHQYLDMGVSHFYDVDGSGQPIDLQMSDDDFWGGLGYDPSLFRDNGVRGDGALEYLLSGLSDATSVTAGSDKGYRYMGQFSASNMQIGIPGTVEAGLGGPYGNLGGFGGGEEGRLPPINFGTFLPTTSQQPVSSNGATWSLVTTPEQPATSQQPAPSNGATWSIAATPEQPTILQQPVGSSAATWSLSAEQPTTQQPVVSNVAAVNEPGCSTIPKLPSSSVNTSSVPQQRHILCDAPSKANGEVENASKPVSKCSKENLPSKKRGRDQPQAELIIGAPDAGRQKRLRKTTYDRDDDTEDKGTRRTQKAKTAVQKGGRKPKTKK